MNLKEDQFIALEMSLVKSKSKTFLVFLECFAQFGALNFVGL